jgi:hypothetical protein
MCDQGVPMLRYRHVVFSTMTIAEDAGTENVGCVADHIFMYDMYL